LTLFEEARRDRRIWSHRVTTSDSWNRSDIRARNNGKAFVKLYTPRAEILQQSAEVAFIEVNYLLIDSIGSVSQGGSSVELFAFSDQG
jgi:hypothetical protein